MYLDFYHLKHRPFAITPDLDFIFWSEAHRHAFDVLRAEILAKSPVTALIGKTGAGKTTLISALRNDPEIHQNHDMVVMTNMFGTASDLQQRLLHTLGKQLTRSKHNPRNIAKALEEIRAGGRTPLIVADEAQTLSSEGASELARMAREAEFGPVPVLIAGQSELGHILKKPGFRDLQDQIGQTVFLGELPLEESEHYIATRLTLAGGRADLFTPDAAHHIHRKASGIPRLMNKLCEGLLFLAAQDELQSIDTVAVQRLMNSHIDPVTLALRADMDGRPVALEEPSVYVTPEPISVPEPVSETPVPDPEPEPTAEREPEPAAPGSALVPVEEPAPNRQRRNRWLRIGLAACLAAIAFLLHPASRPVLDEMVYARLGIAPQSAAVPEARQQEIEAELQRAQDRLQEAEAERDRLRAQVSEDAEPEVDPEFDSVTQARDEPVVPAAIEPERAVLTPMPVADDTSAQEFFDAGLNGTDPQAMVVLFTRAALRGHPRAARYLGQFYETGDGVMFAPAAAENWYALADGRAPDATSDTPGAAKPIFAATTPEAIELVWDGQGGGFVVELADGTGGVLGAHETPLTGAYLERPAGAAQWRVTAQGAEPGDWTPLSSDTQ